MFWGDSQSQFVCEKKPLFTQGFCGDFKLVGLEKFAEDIDPSQYKEMRKDLNEEEVMLTEEETMLTVDHKGIFRDLTNKKLQYRKQYVEYEKKFLTDGNFFKKLKTNKGVAQNRDRKFDSRLEGHLLKLEEEKGLLKQQLNILNFEIQDLEKKKEQCNLKIKANQDNLDLMRKNLEELDLLELDFLEDQCNQIQASAPKVSKVSELFKNSRVQQKKKTKTSNLKLFKQVRDQKQRQATTVQITTDTDPSEEEFEKLKTQFDKVGDKLANMGSTFLGRFEVDEAELNELK